MCVYLINCIRAFACVRVCWVHELCVFVCHCVCEILRFEYLFEFVHMYVYAKHKIVYIYLYVHEYVHVLSACVYVSTIDLGFKPCGMR